MSTFFSKSGLSLGLELRPYQRDTLAAIRENYRNGIRRQVCVAATGTGKTFIFSQIPSLMREELPGQILVLVHTEELVFQNASELRECNPELTVGIEMAERHADPASDIIVASVQTLGRENTKRREHFNWDKISICIVDECHHSICDAYVRIFKAGGFLETDTRKLLVGFTATPNRSDGTPLKEVYEKIVFNYSIRRGIEEKYLCDLIGVRLDTKTCLDYVHTTNGDFNQTELADAVDTPERNDLIAVEWLKEAEPRKTICFAVNILHAQNLAAAFCEHGIAAEAVWGIDPDRAAKLVRHKSGETLMLTNVGVLCEGYNDPSIACVVLASPTKSNLRFTQTVGRGTRVFEGKENCLVLDVIDSTKRHSLISLPSLLGLPANLNLHGTSAVEALGVIEDALREYPHLDMSGLQDLNKIEEYITRVNFWDADVPEEVERHSELTWYRSLHGYVLTLPAMEQLKIEQNILGTFDISGMLNYKPVAATVDSLELAFSLCDEMVSLATPQHMKLLTRNAPWHDGPATVKQLVTLKKLLRGTGQIIPAKLTKGEASRVIGKQIAAFQPRPKWLESKIHTKHVA